MWGDGVCTQNYQNGMWAFFDGKGHYDAPCLELIHELNWIPKSKLTPCHEP